MKRHKVSIAPIVEAQILEQLLYIARDSVDNALAWEDRLRGAIKTLCDFPSGLPIDEAASERAGSVVRKLVFERTYLIHFELDVATRTVEVVNFRHGARLPRPGEP